VDKVGFVGLGIMGTSMARNLIEDGHELVIHNRTRAKAEKLAKLGAEVATSPREVAGRSDVIITMLPGPPEVEEVLAGENGLLEGVRDGSLIVDMSTSSPLLAQELSRTANTRGVGMLDAPVSGGDIGAIEGTLSIMVGGEKEDFERARPLFEAMGKTIVHVGAAGAGQTVKACNQIVVALVIEAVSEALVLGSKAGVKPEKVIDALRRSRRQQGHGGQGREVPLPRLRCGRQGRVSPQGPGDRFGGGQGVRGGAPRHSARGPVVRNPGCPGEGRLGPLGPHYPDRGVVRGEVTVTVSWTTVTGLVNPKLR
jgi:3-hydroxyisobutyrate dehydrogenase-like beta-hydroxyacid dehydrogenase